MADGRRYPLNMDLGLQGRSALVCGASAGIGLAIAQALAAEGARVAMVGRRAELLEREAAAIGGIPLVADLTVAADVERVADETLARFGGLDVLVLNGGGPPVGSALAITPETLESAIALLFTCHVRLVGRCAEALRASGRGRIIAVESIAVKEPVDNLALSNAVRPGVVGWLKTLARELAVDGVTVNTLGPGRIDTDRLRSLYGEGGVPEAVLATIPARRIGRPAEIAAVAAFLASEQASYVTGLLIPVDGGAARGLY